MAVDAPRRVATSISAVDPLTASGVADDGARLLDNPGAAAFLGVSPRQVKVLTARGELQSLLIGRSRRYPLAGLRRYVAERLAEAESE